MSISDLANLDSATLRALGKLLLSYAGSFPPAFRVGQVAGVRAEAIHGCLAVLEQNGWGSFQVAAAIEAMAVAKDGVTPVPGLEFVLSGPSVPGIPTRDTAAVVQALFADAEDEVLVVGYAFYNGQSIFKRLYERWLDRSGLRVRFVLDIGRKANDTSLDDQIISRHVAEFYKRQWPWQPRPELYFDPRALRSTPSERAVIHAKCVIIDRRVALVTSANFTPAAQERNVEVGVLLRDPTHVRRLADFWDGLRDGNLSRT